MRKSFHLYAIITILCWSLAYVFTKLAMQHFSALPLGFLRCAVASIALLAACLITRMPLPQIRDIPWFIASGASGFFFYLIAFNTGTWYVSSATSSVVIASVPVFTALFASVLFKEKLSLPHWLATAVEFAGILVLTLYGAVFTANNGVLLLLLAALSLSCYNLLQRRLIRSYTALQSTTYSIFAGTVLLAIFSPQAIMELKDAPAIYIWYVLILGVFSSAIAYIAWSKAFEKAERTSQVSNYMFFTPFVAGLLAFAIANEMPDPSTWIGGALIIFGAVLFNRANNGSKAPAAGSESEIIADKR